VTVTFAYRSAARVASVDTGVDDAARRLPAPGAEVHAGDAVVAAAVRAHVAAVAAGGAGPGPEAASRLVVEALTTAAALGAIHAALDEGPPPAP